MSNDQLTAAIGELQNVVQGINVQLGDIIRKMALQIDASDALARTLDAKLKEAVNPLVDANLIPAMAKMDETVAKLQEETKDCDKRLREYVVKLESEAARTRQQVEGMDAVKTNTTGVNTRVSEFATDINDIQQKIKDESDKYNMRYHEQQQQMATLNSVVKSGGISSGSQRSRTEEPIVVHKLIINKTALSGTESFEAIDEWYEGMANDVEMIIPGAKAILQEAEKMKSPVDTDYILKHAKSMLMSRVSGRCTVC